MASVDRAKLRQLTAALRTRAEAVLQVFDEELARPEAPTPPLPPVTPVLVQAEIEVYRDAIALTTQQITDTEAELLTMTRSGPYRLIEPTEDKLAKLVAERRELEADLNALEVLLAELSRQ